MYILKMRKINIIKTFRKSSRNMNASIIVVSSLAPI